MNPERAIPAENAAMADVELSSGQSSEPSKASNHTSALTSGTMTGRLANIAEIQAAFEPPCSLDPFQRS